MTYDVAVVGAGPAGSLAALRLSQRGARVALIDSSHPREKPCGGGVTGRALQLVADVIDVRALPARAVRSARFVQTSSSTGDPTPAAPAVVPLSEGALVVASRSDLDGALLGAAERTGACVIRSRVLDVGRDGSGFRLRTTDGTVRSRRLIGADGANSLVRRRFAKPFSRADLSIATGFFAHGATSDEIVIELLADPVGYLWSFPRPTHLAIGVCTQADAGYTSSRLRMDATRWIERTGVASLARLEPYSWPIPSLTCEALRAPVVSGDGWCLVGDAAGLVDPITREGIYFALLSSGWAADALASSLPLPHEQYGERVSDIIGAELARAARFKSRFFQPRFATLLMTAVRDSAAVRAVVADLVAGTQSYRTLKWRLLGTLDIGLLSRWLFGRASLDTRRARYREM